MAATSNHPQILSPKYGQTGNVKLLTANRSLLFAVKWPNLDLKVSIILGGTGKITMLISPTILSAYWNANVIGS